MLKITDKVKQGARITLSETWHEKIVDFGKLANFPYEFTVEEIVKDKTMKETYYVCKSGKKENGKCSKIVLSKNVINYLFGQEVPDSNIGLSFNEFLPLDGSKLLITSVRNPSEVIPGIFKVEPELIELNKKSMICLNSKIYYMIGSGFTSVKYYCNGTKKATWKLLLHPDASGMTDYEETFRDTLVHKSYVEQSCEKLARYLENQGAVNHAKLLREKAKVHDNSKLTQEDELNALSRIVRDKTTLKDASKQLTPIQKDLIKLHHKHNSHHPEFYKSVEDMEKIDIMEMCCDWHARSTQYGTNLLEYVETAQKQRFNFPSWMYAEILHYCNVLLAEI